MRKIACLGVAMAACAAFAETYVWNGASGGDWSAPGNWLVGGAAAATAPTSADSIEFDSASALTVGGSSALAVTRIANTGAGAVTFSCPVQFSGTYYVTQNGAVKFPGGATATYPDNALRTATSTDRARTLDGDFTFTADWTVNNVGDYPWIVPAGSVVHGQVLTGTQTGNNRILRVEEGGSAYFTVVTNGAKVGVMDIDGYLEVSDEVIVQASGTSHFGRKGNVGTVKAKRIAKIANSLVHSYIPNLVVGSGGLGCLVQDYYWQLRANTTVTAYESFAFLGVYRSSGAYDWGIGFLDPVEGPLTLTVNVPEGLTVQFGVAVRGNGGTIRKTGKGTLVMSDTFNGATGFTKPNIERTFVDEGTMRVLADGQFGRGFVDVADGARLEFGPGVTLASRVYGEGTIQLADGVTIAAAAHPVIAKAVEFATAADAVTLAAPDVTGQTAFITGVDAADLSRFTCSGGALSLVGGAVMLPYAAPSGAYVWNGASGGDWSAPGNWLVDGATPTAAPGSGDTILFQNAAPVTVGGAGALTVTKIVTLSDGAVTFSCPVAFAGTYLVNAAAKEPVFAGGATATYPDAALTDMNGPSHTFSGSVTFTQDWTAPLQAAGNPFVVSRGSTLTGKKLAAATYNNLQPELRIDEGAVATFDTVAVGGLLVFQLNGGRLVATGDVTLGGVASDRDFGYVRGSVGTVEANGIYKSVTGNGRINLYVTNMVVGAGGFGMKQKDHTIRFMTDAKITAKDDMTVWEPQDLGSTAPKDTDWGLNLRSQTLTIDTAGHTVNFDTWTAPSNSVVVKEGAGEMVMRGRLKRHRGGTVVKAGTLTVTGAGLQGDGPVTVYAGATLANPVSISHSHPLVLHAGAILKPAQNTYFDVSGGTVALPDEGTVTVDMTDFTFVNGVANPVLAGVAAGDEAKFAARVPAGVNGAFSVADGFLSYTPTSGGGAAADLYWHPTGEATWSGAVAAWTNAAGEQVAFSPYANATVADAATITLSADVEANDVTISAAGDVTLNGAGALGGAGTILKTGAGTFTFNATGGLGAQPVVVSNGVLKLGEDLAGPLGSTADTAPIVVAAGGALDVNYNNASSASEAERSKVTREKLVRVAGEGPDGRGAIVNDTYNSYYTFSDMVLDEDATMGGTKRFDVRGNMSGYVRNGGSVYGPGKTLTVLNPAFFGIVSASVDLKEIVVTNGGALRAEGSIANWNLENGIRLRGGKLSTYGNTFGANVPITAESGANTIESGTGTTTFNCPITVAEGASLAQTGGTIAYGSAVSGNFRVSGGIAVATGGALANGWTMTGARASESIRLRKNGTFTGADINCANFGVSDASNGVVNATFLDSSLDVGNLYIGWGNNFVKGGNVTLGAGTTLLTGKIAIGDAGTNVYDNVKSVLTVDGGTINHTGTLFYVSYASPHAEFVLNAGTVTVDKAAILLHANAATNFAHLGGHSVSVFRQNGGTFNYGGAGFASNEYEDNAEDGAIVLKGGAFNASANWSIPHYIPLCFKDGGTGWTLDQADGTTATWTTALFGNGDVTLNGAATLAGTNEVQGAVGGKWTVGDGFTAGLEGSASLLGGLVVGAGATVTVDIATNRSAVFTARDGGDEFGQAACITSRFNRAIGGTTRGTITHDESFLVKQYAAAIRPFGNRNYQVAYAVGQFYVEPEKAGKWYFKGYCDDYILLAIDGETVLSSVGGAKCATRYGTNTLAAGWHTFRHVATDVGGTFGGAPSMSYNTDGSTTYTPFSVKNLKMRPAADFGDPDNANTVRWSHYKGTSADDLYNNFKRDFDWDFCCITNNLQMLQWYGKNDPLLNNYAVNRFDGWFLVTEEDADKEWKFRTQYDDRCALWIDGVDTGLHGTNKNTLVYSTTLARGWHHFRIQAADAGNGGNAGPWSNKGHAVSYQVADGPQTLFSEATLQLTVCPDGYVQGGVTLASGARLANGAAENAAVIYGEVAGTGTGATLAGPFKFEGGTLAFRNVDPATTDLANVLAFSNVPADMLANVGAITVDYASAPTRGKIPVCPLYGLTEEAAKAKIAVTIAGEPADHVAVKVENGVLTIRNTKGTLLLFR